MSSEVKVASLPGCDVCKQKGVTTVAAFDGATSFGPWAYMCEAHFQMMGVGLGTGRGQRLVLRQDKPSLVCGHGECVVGLPCKREAPEVWQKAAAPSGDGLSVDDIVLGIEAGTFTDAQFEKLDDATQEAVEHALGDVD